MLHAGDVKNGSSTCDDARFADLSALFDTFDDPFVLTPGDNEWTMTGTWVSRDAGGAMLASGHFVTRLSDQGPGFPTFVHTDLLNATGTTVDGDPVRVHVLRHLTITPSGETSTEFERISCTL